MKLWRLWCKALGEKASDNNGESDTGAFIRSLIILQAVITNLFICINLIASLISTLLKSSCLNNVLFNQVSQ